MSFLTTNHTFTKIADETVILCQEEYFRPKCARNQLLYIEQAQYGRMRLSRCVNKDFGYVGCSRNVLPMVESQCSGRRSCSLKVLDETFPVDPCHIDLRSYLEIRYRCIDGKYGGCTLLPSRGRGKVRVTVREYLGS